MRIDFPAAVKELVAKRAGYQCSLPGCSKVTIGPGVKPHTSASIGIAAHIYSASAGGPRGRGGLTEEELAGLDNAIWLCANHAGLVDKNRGTDYPPDLLLSYKALHESKIAREQDGSRSRFNWVDGLRIISSPLFAGRGNIALGKLNILVGDNGSGKSAICEWIAGMSAVPYLDRWQKVPIGKSPVEVQLKYLTPEPHDIRFAFPDEHYPRYYLDDRFTAVPASPLRVIFPQDLFQHTTEPLDDLELVASALRMHSLEVRALCEELPRKGTGVVQRIWFEPDDEDGRILLRADVEGTVPGLPLRALANSECIFILMELSIMAANHLAETHPTVLILDAGSGSLDNEWLERYGRVLTAPEIRFQTIASIVNRDIDLRTLQWAGWKVFRFHGTPPNVTLTAGVREE